MSQMIDWGLGREATCPRSKGILIFSTEHVDEPFGHLVSPLDPCQAYLSLECI
jgi:hypothetical protein